MLLFKAPKLCEVLCYVKVYLVNKVKFTWNKNPHKCKNKKLD